MRVRVTKNDIATGKAGDCFRCAVAMAVQRATGDTEANVVEIDYVFHIHAHSRYIPVPWSVRSFLVEFDHDLRRNEDGTVILSPTATSVKPFVFSLPSFSSREWKEKCYGCEQLFDVKELDDEGNCPECVSE